MRVMFKESLKCVLKGVYEVSYLKLFLKTEPYAQSKSKADELAETRKSGVREEIKKDLKKDSEEG